MSTRQLRPATRSASSLRSVVCCFGLASALLCASQAARGQLNKGELVRTFNVSGQVSLPDDRPAARVRVRLAGRGGIMRETITNDNGRFEFPELPGGSYSLTAQSLADSSLSSATADADTSRTATGTLTVNISLRAAPAERHRPGVVSAAEYEQKVPAEARKAFRHGLKLKDEERADEALASFTRAIELHPDYVQALSERGNLLVARGELAAAASDFERALSVDAHYEPALRGAGYCKLEAREFAPAAEYFERAAAVEPANASTHLLLGVADMELGRRDDARKALRLALEIDPKRAVRAHIHLANLYAAEHLYEQAADELRVYLNAVIMDPKLDEMRQVEARWRALARAK